MTSGAESEVVAAEPRLFPFPAVRDGQREFLADAATAVREGKHLVAHAPTGIGKTAAVLAAVLPAALREGKFVLFLTPKQSQHAIAVETLRRIRALADIVAVDVISKQAMCPYAATTTFYSAFHQFCQTKVRTQNCRYYARDEKPVAARVREQVLHVHELVDLSRRHGTCPHKTALTAAEDAHVLVCDYSYVFSPLADRLLPRLGRTEQDLVLVVDEAHNLPERIRGELSGDLTPQELRRAAREARQVDRALVAVLLRAADALEAALADLREERLVGLDFLDEALAPALRGATVADLLGALESAGEMAVLHDASTILLEVAKFFREWQRTGDGVARIARGGAEARVSYRLLDPSILSAKVFRDVHASVLMSGTLYPGDVVADLLGIEAERRVVRTYESPFPRANRLVLLQPRLTTLYSWRGNGMYDEFAAALREVCEIVPGNVAAFFPSYALLGEVARRLPAAGVHRVVLQERRQHGKDEKAALVDALRRLRDGGGALLLGVQGGSLSEGVDYEDNLLSAVVVAGVPISPPSAEGEALRVYYEKKFGPEKGYDYAYLHPAINKMLQAAGRCIRGERDRGAIVFMDRRLLRSKYAAWIPADWKPKVVREVAPDLRQFFRGDSGAPAGVNL